MLNWKIRYSAIIKDHPELADPTYSVVEVGPGPFGIAQYLKRRVVGVEPNPVSAGNGYLEVIQGVATDLPFRDEEIDFVLCVDVIEHIPPADRRQVIKELIRISRQRVIISCPCHHWAEAGEKDLCVMFERCNVGVPGWLREHLDFGLPMMSDILGPIVETGYKFEVIGNETLLQHYSGIAMDWLFPRAGELNGRINERAPRATPIIGNEWDLYYSFMFSVFKQSRSAKVEEIGRRSLSNLRQHIVPSGSAPKLYAIYHADFPTGHLGKVTPLLVGEAAVKATCDQLTDRLSDGTSLPNTRWCELSGIYRIWKEGPRSRVVGFSHYRRLFDFRNTSAVTQTNIPPDYWSNYTDHFYDDSLINSLDDNTVAVARPVDLGGTVFDNYSVIHNTNDYLGVLSQIAMSSSPLLRGIMEQFSQTSLYAYNMFITSWKLFCELCDFWFLYLGRFVEAHLQRDASDYQKRDVAFLAERIFDAWVRYRRSQGTTVIELPIFFLTQ